jgi:hypothetical protein
LVWKFSAYVLFVRCVLEPRLDLLRGHGGRDLTYLGAIRQRNIGSELRDSHLRHILEELFTTPSFHPPVIVVLLRATNTQSTITAGTTAKELPSAQLDLAVINARHFLGNNIPVSVLVEKLRPSGTWLRRLA